MSIKKLTDSINPTQNVYCNSISTTSVTLGTSPQTPLSYYETTTYSSGFSITPVTTGSLTITLTRIGNVVIVNVPALSITTSTSTSKTCFSNNPIPIEFRPSSTITCGDITWYDSTTPTQTSGMIKVTSDGTISFYFNQAANTFSTSKVYTLGSNSDIGTVGCNISFSYIKV